MKRLIKAKTGMGLQEVKTPTRLEYLKKKKEAILFWMNFMAM